MARTVRLLIPSDSSVPTSYYEIQYRISGNANWTTQTFNSPLPLYTTVSPAASTPNIVLAPLPDATAYEYQVRRFDLNGNASAYTSGTFNTTS